MTSTVFVEIYKINYESTNCAYIIKQDYLGTLARTKKINILFLKIILFVYTRNLKREFYVLSPIDSR